MFGDEVDVGTSAAGAAIEEDVVDAGAGVGAVRACRARGTTRAGSSSIDGGRDGGAAAAPGACNQRKGKRDSSKTTWRDVNTRHDEGS